MLPHRRNYVQLTATNDANSQGAMRLAAARALGTVHNWELRIMALQRMSPFKIRGRKTAVRQLRDPDPLQTQSMMPSTAAVRRHQPLGSPMPQASPLAKRRTWRPHSKRTLSWWSSTRMAASNRGSQRGSKVEPSRRDSSACAQSMKACTRAVRLRVVGVTRCRGNEGDRQPGSTGTRAPLVR